MAMSMNEQVKDGTRVFLDSGLLTTIFRMQSAYEIKMLLRRQIEKQSEIEHKPYNGNDTKYRPCIVDGKKALFHKWAEKTPAAVQSFEVRGEFKAASRLLKDLKTGAIEINPRPSADITLLKRTVAIVEYADGSVGEVDPASITFVDGKINEYAF